MRTAIVLALLSLAMSANAADPPPQPAPAEERTADPGPAVNDAAQKSAPAASSSPAAKSDRKEVAGGQPAAAARRSTDRLDLDTTVVTGNRELPKVLYIVPWKKADIGDLPAQPFNTLLDEALTPVDRDVFRREVTYYGAVSSGANAPGAAPDSPAAGPEK